MFFRIYLYTENMLEHYEKAAKALDIDIDKIMLDWTRAIVRDELTKEGQI